MLDKANILINHSRPGGGIFIPKIDRDVVKLSKAGDATPVTKAQPIEE